MSIATGKKSAFQQAIMEKGFFPENLPPAFSVKKFYDTAKSLDLFSDDQITREKPLSLSRYNETKRGGQRRVFATPNPLFFVDASVYLGSYRSQLNRLLTRSPLSRSIPKFDESFERALQIDTFSEFTSHRRRVLSTSRYVVKSDISRFFPSIYTHSIPWAVHGKPQAKKDRKVNSTTTYANKLDYLVRQSQDGQTIGIPVGPDISRIISELISSAIDQEFLRQVGPHVVGARLVDDIYLGASSLEEADALLSAYRDAMRRFELDINENKTHIFEARLDLEPYWPVSIRREIEQFAQRGATRASKAELTSYLDEIIRTANAENDDGIIKYAIRRLDHSKLWREYWDCLEPFLVRVAVNFSHSLDYVARVVVWRFRTSQIDNSTWRKVCNTIISYHSKMGNDSEVVWASWILKEIGGKIPVDCVETAVNRCGPFSLLMLFDLIDRGQVTGRFTNKSIIDRLGDSPMTGNDWLLAYEGERLFGLRIKGKNRNDYSVFGELIDNDVQFYDPNAVPAVFQNIENYEDVTEALEDRIGSYDSDEFDVADDDYDLEDFF